MARPKSSKIFIKIKDAHCDFMWANIGPDDSVMFGFFTEGDEKTLLILSEIGEIKPGDIEHGQSLPNPKINFHKSGICKLTTKIGKTEGSIDRCTVLTGEPLCEISNPKRMLEILLPKKLKVTNRNVTDRDIILDASSFPKKPWRCTVSCMSLSEFKQIVKENRKFVETSLCEFYDALEINKQVWVFTLRVSREDTDAPENHLFFIPGQIKWGNVKV